MPPGDAEWIGDVLACLWSAGQSDDWSQLSDRVLRAEQLDVCEVCAGPIVPGEWIRQETAVRKGEVETFRYCQECCEAMTAWYEVPSRLGHQDDLEPMAAPFDPAAGLERRRVLRRAMALERHRLPALSARDRPAHLAVVVDPAGWHQLGRQHAR